MNNKKYFQEQEPKLKLEAVLKSLLCSLAVGFSVSFVVALATWIASINGIWNALVLFVVAALISFPFFYLKKFNPTVMQNARRIDRLGLEERLITMVEFANDTSYITELQRKDAQNALAKVDKKSLRIEIPRAIIISLVICAVLGLGMSTVNVLAANGKIPGGNEILNNIVDPDPIEYVTVSYVIEEGGILEGDEDQIIVKGTDTTYVTAVADDGFVFQEWSDGFTEPTRIDRGVTEDVIYTAVFVEMEDEGGSGGDGDGEGEGEGDEPQDAPPESESNQQGNSGTPSNPNGGYNQGGGGASQPNNQIIDGETYYKEVLESYQDAAEDRIQNEDSEFTDDDIEFIKKYLGIV